MRVEIFVDHLNKHEKIAERQLHAVANKWCKENWGKPADECNYRGMAWTTYEHASYARGEHVLYCSVFLPGRESVALVVQERKN